MYVVLVLVCQNVAAAASAELTQYIANVLIGRNTLSCYLTLSFFDFLLTRMAIVELPINVAVK